MKTILERVLALAARCKTSDGEQENPLPDDECDAIVQHVFQEKTTARRIPNLTISNWLEITDEEAEELESWPSAARFGDGHLNAKGRFNQSLFRRGCILLAHSEVRPGVVLSLRRMRRILEAEFALTPSTATLARDYRMLGLLQEDQGHEPDEKRREVI